MWYGGTAHAVYQNLDFLREQRADTVLILSGDHIYKMDYRPLLRYHETMRADATLAVMNVKPDETSRFGIVLTDSEGRVTDFLEKPKEAPSTLANMGIYVFDAHVLMDTLEAMSKEHADLDFGKHVLPALVPNGRLHTYRFEGYWVDVGTIDAYWQTSMELLSGSSTLDLYDPKLGDSHAQPGAPPGEVRPAVADQGEHGVQRVSRARPGDPLGALARRLRVTGRGGAGERGHATTAGSGRAPWSIAASWTGTSVIGGGTQLGYGDDYDTPNEKHPDRFNTGITVVGIAAHVAPNIRIGRNVVIEPDVDEEAYRFIRARGAQRGHGREVMRWQ